MKQKLIGGALGIVLSSFAAIGAFASQDSLPLVGGVLGEHSGPVALEESTTPTETVEATETTEATETPEATETTEPTEEPTDEPTEEATEEPTEEATESAEVEDQRDILGIPEDHPVFTEEAEEGSCEQHQFAVKTTPSGNEVRVPCVVVEKDHGHGHEVDSEGAETEDAGESDD